MQELAVLIDLNTYKITNAMLEVIKNFSKDFNNVLFNYYNYTTLLHKNLRLDGKTFPALSSRRRVQIDIRIICDAVEYACAHKGGNILLLCGVIDSSPLFAKLTELGAATTFATMQKVDVGATNYLLLTRETSNSTIIPTQISACKPTVIINTPHTGSITKTRTLVTAESAPLMQTPPLDDYDTQLQALNLIIKKLKY